MSASERKEKNDGQRRQLSPFFQIPPELQKPLKLEIDPHSRSLIDIGDSKEWELDDEKTNGQRYVVGFFIKDEIVHMRVNPSFKRVIEEKERKEEWFTKLRAYAAAHFKCKPEEIIFADNKIWTGVVHTALIQNVHENEADMVKNSIATLLSFIKKDGIYYWKNRSARNEEVFLPDPLALACYMFYEKSDYLADPDMQFDLYYHLSRAIPEKFLRPIVEVINKELGGKADLKECVNFVYEAKWEKIRELFITDRPEAVKQIQHMLIKNMYLYLLNIHAKHDSQRAELILIAGIIVAYGYGINLDFDYIPPEFKDELPIVHIALQRKNYRLANLILDYSILSALETGNNDQIRKMLDLKTSLIWGDRVSKRTQLEYINLFEDILNAELIDLNTKNHYGRTLLHILAGTPEEYDYIAPAILFHLRDVNLLDNDGHSILYYAVEEGNQNFVDLLITSNADPHLVDKKGQTAFTFALEIYRRVQTDKSFNILYNCLKSQTQFPEFYADKIVSQLIDFVSERLLKKKDNRIIPLILNNFKIQENPKIKSMLLNAIMTTFIRACIAHDYNIVAYLCRITQEKFPLVDYDFSLLRAMITRSYEKLSILSSRQTRQFFIEITNTFGIIPKKLYETDASGQFKKFIEQEAYRNNLVNQFLDLANSGDVKSAREFIRKLSEQDLRLLYQSKMNKFYMTLAQVLVQDTPDWKVLLKLLDESKDGQSGQLSLKIIGYALHPFEDELITYLKKNQFDRVKRALLNLDVTEKELNEMKLPYTQFTTPQLRQHFITVVSEEKPDFNKKNAKGETLLDILIQAPGDHVNLFNALLLQLNLDQPQLQKTFLQYLEKIPDTIFKIHLINVALDPKRSFSKKLFESPALGASSVFVSAAEAFRQQLVTMKSTLSDSIKPPSLDG